MSKFRVTLRVDFDNNAAIGPGKIALLEKMLESGSLSQAARELDMSYRRAWQLLDTMNRIFRAPLVKTSIGGAGGGGAALTELGQSVITAYRSFEEETNARAASHFQSVGRQVVAGAPAVRRSLSKTSRSAGRARATRVAAKR